MPRLLRSLRPTAPTTIRLGLLLLIVQLLGVSVVGCATRSVRDKAVRKTGLEVDLVRQVKGFSTQPLGYEHPAIISIERMQRILAAIEVETRDDESTGFIRQPAFHPDIVLPAAQGLIDGLRDAGPDQEIAVNVVRKSMRLGVFNRKHLTSFIAYIDDGQLFLTLRRVDWPIPRREENKELPVPRRDYRPMDFRVVSGDHLFYAGGQTLEIDWQNAVFRKAYRLPGSTGGEKRRRQILEQSPVPKADIDESNPIGEQVGELSPDQLRALADLEEDRRAGRITEAAYQRAKRQILRQR